MKAIITGCHGFIGFNLSKKLKQLNWDVLGIDDLSSGLDSNRIEGFEYVTEKIQNRDKMAEVLARFRPNAIFHFAAVPRVSYSVDNPFDTTEANVLGTVSLLEGIVKNEPHRPNPLHHVQQQFRLRRSRHSANTRGICLQSSLSLRPPKIPG